jgi:hypothetical protein
MTLNQLPFCLVANDGVNTRLIIPGASAGGHDAAFDLGDASRTAMIKRDGTLLDHQDFMEGLPRGGSSLITESFGLTTSMVTGRMVLAHQTLHLVMVNVPVDTVVRGVKFIQAVQGNYTASSYNGVGLYSYSAGNLTLIASSTNDGNTWQQAAYGFYTHSFQAGVNVIAGIFWIGILYSRSAEVTAPQIAGAQDVISSVISTVDLQNSAVTYGSVAGQSSLPSSLAMSSVTPVASRCWLGLTSDASPPQ